ncbi:MAG TPA: phage portal protein [Longimicrobium sp.]|nr:phage portal protein [Longimicrobium sp.]
MGLLDWLGGERRDLSPEETFSFSNPAGWLRGALGGGTTFAGVRINASNALNIAAVYCAVRVLTDMMGATPAITYRRLARGKERAREHPVFRVLHRRPNPEMTPFTLKEVAQGHLALRGNAYMEIEWDNAGQVANLWPLPPTTEPFRFNGERWYRTEIPRTGSTTTPVTLPSYRVLHIPGFGFDGLKGYDPITLARESLGFTKAADEFGARFFANGTRVSGILSTDKVLSKPAFDALRESWTLGQEGLSNAHRVAILDNGLKWEQTSLSPENAQFLESRQFQLDEIARWFKVPPHMIYNLLRSTNNNIEQQSLEFIRDTAQPWFVRWEEALSWDLFVGEERDTFFVEFLMDALLRGDSAGRAELYKALFQVGGASPNDILERENMNPVEGGDRRFIPMNMVPLDRVDDALDRAPRGAENRDFTFPLEDR